MQRDCLGTVGNERKSKNIFMSFRYNKFKIMAIGFFFVNSFYCLTYTTYNTILTLPTLLTLIKILTPITLLTLRYITVLSATLAKKYLQEFLLFCLNITFCFFLE